MKNINLNKTKILIALSIFLVAGIVIWQGYQMVSKNQYSKKVLQSQLLSGKLLSANWRKDLGGAEKVYHQKHEPYDYFFLQRSYPDETFDIIAYEKAIKKVSKNISLLKNSSPKNINSSWTIEGPGNIGGRINVVITHPGNSNIMYVGNANGGVFKTIDGGNSWIPVFDEFSFLAIGAITLDPINPDIVYVGTGDPNISGYPFIGDGIYKSIDGGANWTHIGLTEQRIISRIVINPDSPNIIYAATMGLPFERNNDRGLYRTTDGGNIWEQILFISDEAGIIDLVMDPYNSQVLYAAGWNRIRNNSESVVYGQAAKIYKTSDGGDTWDTLSNGLPTDDMSRIGLCISQLTPNVLFAVYVDTTYQLEAIYKTVDAGLTWNTVPTGSLDPNALGGFGWFFGQIRVNPDNDDELFILGVDLYKTTNGGNNWFMAGPPWYDYTFHADKHDLLYVNSSTILSTTDGGLYKSTDGGNTWTDIENIPNTQFYRVACNPHTPGVYYGGSQDNGTTCGNAGNINSWVRLLGGDGFQPLFDPVDPYLWYAETQYGGLYYFDEFSWDYLTDGIDINDRRSWDMPIIMSKVNPSTLYTGTYRVYKMEYAPYDTWYPISSDLTDGIDSHRHVITTIDESSINTDYLYVGTSDANVWRTLDGGFSWDDITGILPERYVTSVIASPNNVNTVFVAHSGYKDNEFIPHIHKSSNNGTTWEDISGDLPQLAINNIYVFDETNDQIIFAATDGGVYVTQNGGINWQRIGNNMPVVPVYDIDYDEINNKLIAGTHARSLMSFPVDSILLTTSVTQYNAHYETNFIVYPSLANNEINLKLDNLNSDLIKVALYSNDGKLVKSAQIINNQSLLNISVNSLKPGLYFVVVYNDHVKHISKFIKV